jgi:hypothetical protein
MFAIKPDRKWSAIGLTALLVSIAGAILLSIAEALLRTDMGTVRTEDAYIFLGVLTSDFRSLFIQGVYASTIFFVGAKFFETRSILTIGFDKLDRSKISMKGPDETNTVWIGHRYGTKLEAEAIVASLNERLKESAAVEANS